MPSARHGPCGPRRFFGLEGFQDALTAIFQGPEHSCIAVVRMRASFAWTRRRGSAGRERRGAPEFSTSLKVWMVNIYK